MSEQQVSDLLQAMSDQVKAINRLAESTETLAALIYQSMADSGEAEDLPQATYLSGKPKR